MMCSKCGAQNYLLVSLGGRILCLRCLVTLEPVLARLLGKQLASIISMVELHDKAVKDSVKVK